MKLNSFNEWDRLRTVIVGSVENFSPGLEFNARVSDDQRIKASNLVKEAYPAAYLDEVQEDLSELCNIMENFGVKVLRPEWPADKSDFSTPDWTAEGFDIYNVRDLHIIFGNTLVVSAPSSRFRLFEQQALQKLFYEHFFDEGFKWISAPIPRLNGQYLHEIQRERSDLEKQEDISHSHLSGGMVEAFHRLDELEVIFDAANIMRFGDEALFLVSSTGNMMAAKWLQSVLPEIKLHITDAYRSSHLDSTILPLKEGFVLLNSARVDENNCPQFLRNWDKLFFNEPAPVCEKEVEFHSNIRMPLYKQLQKLGCNSVIGHISSPWAGLNVMSLDSETVLVHDRQTSLIKALESRKFKVIPVRMRHCYTMLGGLHCSTLDVVRND